MMTFDEAKEWARDYPHTILHVIPDDALILEIKGRQATGRIQLKDIQLSTED